MIKKFIVNALLLGTATSVFAASNAIRPIIIDNTANAEGQIFHKTISAVPSRQNVESRANSTVKLIVGVLTDPSRGQEVQTVFAISADSSTPRLYEGVQSGSTYVMEVVPGKYDIVSYLMSDNENTQIILFNENVEITSQKSVLLNQRDATISTSIQHTTPTGDVLRLASEGDSGNTSIADIMLMLRHNDFGPIFQGENAAFRNIGSRIAVNKIPEHFNITRMDAYSWEGGPAFMVIPIDFNKEFNGPDGNGWHSKKLNFTPTPLGTAYGEIQESPRFQMTAFFVMSGAECLSYVGMGNYNHEFPTNNIHYWAPADYDGFYQYYPQVRDDLVASFEASAASMPYKNTTDGLVPTGLKFVNDGSLMIKDGSIPTEGHPRNIIEPAENELMGNAVPALVNLPVSTDAEMWTRGFTFNYTGRYGEALGYDAANLSEFYSESSMEALGGYRREMSITRDGQVICSSPHTFANWLNWGNGEVYECNMKMHNVLIDGEIEGVNTSALTYRASDGFIPTITSLQLRNADDKIADRFTSAAGASVELTAATFSFKPSSGTISYNFKAPSKVTVEYAPHKSDTFQELTVEEKPEYFFLPGYGSYYKAGLEGVTANSESGWYDLRITVDGAEGSRQSQVLSPAFKLESTGGVDFTITDNEASTCSVYAVDGTLIAKDVNNINSLGLEAGIYIEVRGDKARKVAVK